MKKNIILKILVVFIFLFNISFLFSNNETLVNKKEYFTSNWQRTTDSNLASYYRIINYNSKNIPVGIIKDYYITGELQGEFYFSYFDPNNEKNCKYEGKYLSYYKNGNIKNIITFENNIPKGSFIYCDENNNCEKIFRDQFDNNYNNWYIGSKAGFGSSQIWIKEMVVSCPNKKNSWATSMKHKIDTSKDFTIEVYMKKLSGQKNKGGGLMFGANGPSNNQFFLISNNGYFIITKKIDGLIINIKDWTRCNFIKKKINHLKIKKVGNVVYYAINGQIVHQANFSEFIGNNVGFNVAGKQKISFDNLMIKESIPKPIIKEPIKDSWKGNGSGIIITKNGLIVTNHHVINKAKDIVVDFYTGNIKHSYNAKIKIVDKQNDLAILEIDDENFKPFKQIAYNIKFQTVDVGSKIFVLGYPMALSVMGEEMKFTDGTVSSKTGYKGNISTYQISAPIQPGNSGGPLFDYKGNLVGIVNAKIPGAENVGYAIKSNYLRNLIDVLPNKLILPNSNMLKNKNIPEQIKVLREFVVLIKIR